MQTFFLDTETTGLHPPADKLVEVTIINKAEEVLLDNLVNPLRSIGFDTTIALLAAAKRYSNQTTYELFIHQFALNLANITKKEAPSLGSVQE